MTGQETRNGWTRRGLLAGAAAGGAGVAAALIESTPVLAAGTRSGNRADAPLLPKPMAGASFVLEGPGLALGTFTACRGLSTEVKVVEFREGGDPATVRKIPGPVSFHEFRLERPLNASRAASEWLQMVVDGHILDARKDCELAIIGTNGDAVARYQLDNAWPSNVEVGMVTIDGTDVLLETLTIACEHILRIAP